MFSGIIEEMGVVKGLDSKKNLAVLKLRVKKINKAIKLGDSVCVSGACLTVSKKSKDLLNFDMMKETLDKTTLGQLKMNDKVNLERALKISDRLNGHIVTGHVDCVSKITGFYAQENYLEVRIAMNKNISKFIAEKGSVCIDGISLTIGEVRKKDFSVYIIPFTKMHTTLGIKKKGDFVNIEVDILARYVLQK